MAPAILCVLLLGSACDANPEREAEAVQVIADDYFAAWSERNPEFATMLGLANAAHDRLQDNSIDALERWHEREDEWYARVRRIDAGSIVGRPEWTTLGYLREALEASRQERVCRSELWQINQSVGWHLGFAQLAGIQPVGTAAEREAALARARDIARYTDTEIANLGEGLRLGYLAAREPVERMIEQVENLVAIPTEESPLMSPATRDSTPGFREAMRDAIATEVYPALHRLRRFLVHDYLPNARTSPGVSTNPDGRDCYRARVRSFTTLEASPEELHRRGIETLEALKAERAALAARHGTTPELLLRSHQELPENRFGHRREIIEYSEGIVARATAEAAGWFNRMPLREAVIEQVPEFQERSAPGGLYFPGPPDGSRPGEYRLNTSRPETRSKIGLETLAFHEAVPGHHLQLSLASQRESAHPLTRYLINSGFAEGWALYAERLADEMGLFSSDAQRLAMLNAQIGRAVRLVVDPAIHTLGWSRDEALAFWGETFSSPPGNFAGEVDRYIAWPGQAVSYVVGMLEIQRLRNAAEARLGERFDVRRFHDCLLEDGSVPLAVLNAKMEACLS